MKRYLFSYGTLSPERAPDEIAPVVKRLRRIGTGKVRGRLYDFGDYPGAVLSKTGPAILGHIFELPDAPDVIEKLDEYEGFDPAHPQGSLFVRKRSLVEIVNGKKVWCWIYVYNRPLGDAPPVAASHFSKSRNYRSS